MSDFDFISLPKVLLVVGVITLYVTVIIAILKSLLFKRKVCSPYHTSFVFSEKYKGIEKRRAPRIPVTLKATLNCEKRSFSGEVTIKDISFHGLKCEAKKLPVDLSSRDKVTFQIPAQKELGACMVNCKIVWKQEQDELFLLGTEFLSKNDIMENYIKYINKHNK